MPATSSRRSARQQPKGTSTRLERITINADVITTPRSLRLSANSSIAPRTKKPGRMYGAQYGGSTSAILLRLPGESSAVVATLDGYAMAQKGKAGIALAIAAIGSFIAGTIGTLILAAFAPVLARFAVTFGASEYFALM